MSIPYKQFIHPVDKTATEAVRAIPGFDAICKKVTEMVDEKSFKICATASMIQLGPNQYPNIYAKLGPICEKLQIEVPELYLGSNGNSLCEVFGDTHCFIILNYGAFWSFDEDQIEVLLAQACGHIVCHHALYNVVCKVIETAGPDGGGIISWAISKGIKGAISFWKNCSEFSADRVAAFYFHDSKPVIDMLAKLAGAAPCVPGQINMDAFLAQGKNYSELLSQSAINKVLTMFNPLEPAYPLCVFRASSVKEFEQSFDYDGFLRIGQQQSMSPVAQGAPKKDRCNIEILFSIAKGKGIQFLASKVRNAINSDALTINVNGINLIVDPNKTYSNVFRAGVYKFSFKTRNRSAEYTLTLLDDTRLIVEWVDQEDMIRVREEKLVQEIAYDPAIDATTD